jgi:uncharacterized delta-60 repeat protein
MTMRQRIRLAGGLALVLVPSLMAPRALAAPAHLDPGFGSGGIARTPLPPTVFVKGLDEIAEIAATADGDVVARSGGYPEEVRHYGADGALIGTETHKGVVELRPPEAATADGGRLVGRSGEGKRAVTRYKPGGAPDGSFGSGGTSEALPFSVEAVAALPSGKVLAAGAGVFTPGGTKSPGVSQVFVARLGADGKLDPGFGKGGIVKLHSEDEVTDQTVLHVQGRAGEGAEVVTGSVAVALDASGNLDHGFGEGGRVMMLGDVVGAGAAAGEALLVAGTKPTGSAPAAGGREPDPDEFYAARYTAAGKLDPAFAAGSGIAVLDPEGEVNAGSAQFEPDGSVVIGGFAFSHPPGCPLGYFCEGAPIVVRFTPDGRPDPGFGNGGMVRLTALSARFGSGYTKGVAALAARPTGGLFAAGATQQTAFVAAIGADGSLDGGFGSGGIVSQGSTETAYSAPVATAVDGSGDIFVATQTDTGSIRYGDNAVLRYSAEGGLDHEFGEEGAAVVPAGVRGLAVAPDGTSFVISGEQSPGSSLTEITPAGAIDPAFGSGGSVLFPFDKDRLSPEAVVRMADGDLLVAGNLGPNLSSRPAVLRYLPDGQLDPSFGKGGVKVLNLGRGRYWLVQTMTIDRHGRILLAGSAPRVHQRGCCTRAGVLIRLRSNGGLDRSFGRGGGVLIGHGAFTAIEGLTLRGNRILAAATFTKFAGLEPESAGDLLFSVRPNGTLDRRFGNRGVAKAQGGEETVSVFSTPRRILLVRSGFYGPLLSFSPSGRPEPKFPRRLKGLLPRRQKEDVPAGPSATLDGKSLVFAWADAPPKVPGHGRATEVNLQRLLLR